jgi:transposase
MIRAGFLTSETREELTALVRDGKAESRVTRRANALLLLDKGWSCARVAEALFMDDDTIRYWHELYQDKGLTWLGEFGYKGRACEMTAAQQEALKKWVEETLPRTTMVIGEWIERTSGISYTRSAIIKLLKRLGMEYRKPTVVSKKLDPTKQAAFIKAYNDLLNNLADDEAVMFADAMHPTHEVRPTGCWAPKGAKVAIEQTSGRDRLNVHGAIDLETGKTKMIEVLTVNALSTIALLLAIETMYPLKRWIHVFLDNARYHHAELVQEWLARPGCRIKLHFIPTCRVEDRRACLGRCLSFLLSRPFVCECLSISTMLRLLSPPRRTQRADFPRYAHPFASCRGLWDLSCWGVVRPVPTHSVAVE